MINQSDVPRRLVPDATIQVVLASVSNGATLQDACEAAGIARNNLYRWMKDDPQLAEQYVQAVASQTRSRFVREDAGAAVNCNETGGQS